MATEWFENEKGIVFTDVEALDEYLHEYLESLVLDQHAYTDKNTGNIIILHEDIVLLSDGECELLGLPKKNPYCLYVKANGDLGHNDLHYFVEVLQANGVPYINPKFNGAFLHIDSDTTYRLSLDQYQLLCIAANSNKDIANVERYNLSAFNMINLSKIQRYTKKSSSKLEAFLSEENNPIVIPKKIDIEFKKDTNGSFYANPVILEENEHGELSEINKEDFQNVFVHRAVVQSVYRGKNRTRYICTDVIKDGLRQVKKVKNISEVDKKRFEIQPRELFSDDVFYFASKEHKNNIEENDWDVVDDDENQDIKDYSERVKGLVDIKRGSYSDSSRPSSDWLPIEGETVDIIENEQKDIVYSSEIEPLVLDGEPVKEANGNYGVKTDDISSAEASNSLDLAVAIMDEASSIKHDSQRKVLDIFSNFENIDYRSLDIKRIGKLDESALKNDIRLFDYQKAGVMWMFKVWQLGFKGVLLADDMGLGKTLQTLAFVFELKKGLQGKYSFEKPILIVAPTALLKNWQNESMKFINDTVLGDIVTIYGNSLKNFATGELTPNGKKKIKLKFSGSALALTTYETLRDYQFSFAEVDWGIVVLDEAQKIKNPSAGVTKAIKAMKYDYAICLTGTPVENSWIDLWSIMDFVQPAKLADLKNFKSNYIARLRECAGDINSIEILGRELKSDLEPHFLRRLKKDNLEGLPKKSIHRCCEEMPHYQKCCYMSVVELGKRKKIHPLMMIAKLRDISLHPDLGSKTTKAFYDMSADDVINQSARLIILFKVLEDVRQRDEKALIFLVSKKMQMILKHLIKEKFGIKLFNPVNGEMNGVARQKIIDMFNMSNGFNVLILSPEAAGVGFTITSANNVIHLSRMWNPAKEDQATDRVYRIGQQKDVNVYLPLACHKDFGKGGSFDEKLDELLAYKRVLSENVIYPTADSQNDGLKIFNELTAEDIDTDDEYVWSIEDIDTVIGDVFEKIVEDIYNSIEGLSAKKTPHSNDYGVDVVVLSSDNMSGYLIQCKHKLDYSSPLGNKGVQEVCAAIQYYNGLYTGIDFEPIVITNAMRFTSGAIELAEKNNVKLIARHELSKMLNEYKVLKH